MNWLKKISNYYHINIKKDYKVIFLDIDGVLNLIPQGEDEYGDLFHPHLVNNLKSIIDKTDAKIVITSTWRFSGLKFIEDMWKHRGLPGEIIGITPHIDICKRGEEIEKWLEKNPIKDYVIIDDDSDMLPNQMDRLIKTSDNHDHIDCVDIGYGLTKKCSIDAINVLDNVHRSKTFIDRVVCYNEQGLQHNPYGPAVEYYDGQVEYWVNGEYYSPNKFKLFKRVNNIKKIIGAGSHKKN